MFFDKDTEMTFDQWRSSNAYWLLNRIDFRPTDWISSEYMTDEEHLRWKLRQIDFMLSSKLVDIRKSLSY